METIKVSIICCGNADFGGDAACTPLCCTNEIGLKDAPDEYIIFAKDGDVFSESRIEKQLLCMRAHNSNISFCSASLRGGGKFLANGLQGILPPATIATANLYLAAAIFKTDFLKKRVNNEKIDQNNPYFWLAVLKNEKICAVEEELLTTQVIKQPDFEETYGSIEQSWHHPLSGFYFEYNAVIAKKSYKIWQLPKKIAGKFARTARKTSDAVIGVSKSCCAVSTAVFRDIINTTTAKSVDFLIVYEVRQRELDSICLLTAELKRRGYKVVFINSFFALFCRYSNYKAKVVLTSACYNDITYNFFTGLAESFDKVVNLQWEQMRTNLELNSTKSEPWDFKDIALRTHHIAWGEENKNRLCNQYDIQENRVTTLGYMPLDFYRQEFSGLFLGREKLFSQFGLRVNLRTILFISSFTFGNIPKSDMEHFTDDTKNRLVAFYKSQQEVVLLLLCEFLEKHTDIQVIYRPHPAENDSLPLRIAAQKYNNLYVIGSEAIRQWIFCADIVYSWNSTSAVEVYAAKKPLYILRPIGFLDDFDYPEFADCRVIKTLQEMEDTLTNEVNKDFPIDEKQLLQFFSIEQTPSYIRIADFLEKVVQDNSYHSPRLAPQNTRTWHTRRLLKMLKVAFSNKKNKPPFCYGSDWCDDDYISFAKRKMQQNYCPQNEIDAIIKAIGNSVLGV